MPSSVTHILLTVDYFSNCSWAFQEVMHWDALKNWDKANLTCYIHLLSDVGMSLSIFSFSSLNQQNNFSRGKNKRTKHNQENS